MVRIEAFRQGLRELGYVEGKNIVIEWRSAEEKPDRLSALAAELARLKLDVIVTGSPTATRASAEGSNFYDSQCHGALDNDPVGSGVVASLARPGGNITGLSTLAPEISGKRLELLKEIVPRLSRVAVLGTSTQPGYAQVLKEIGTCRRGVQCKASIPRRLVPKDIGTLFRAASKGARGRSPRAGEQPFQFPSNTGCRTCSQGPTPSDISSIQNMWKTGGL